jgi:RHS repeat-associated protein
MVFSIGNSIDQTEAEALLQGIDFIREKLFLLQSDPTHAEQLQLIFEGDWSGDLLDKVLSDIQAGQEPQIEVVEDSQLSALGAYSAATNTIYLSQKLLDQAVQDSSLLVSVILEELGHYIDAKLNDADSTGDEGQLFALLVQQGFLSQSQLTTLKQQSDQGQITIDGQDLAVEFARDSYGVIDNIGAFGLGNLFVGDLRSTINGDGSVTINGSALQSALPQNITGLSGNTGSDLTRAFATPYQGLSRRVFTKNADGSYSAASSADKATLRLVGDHYELTEEDGTTVVLWADGRLNYLQNRNGFRITANYDASSGKLTSLLGSDGESLTFQYNAQGRIDRITDRANQQTTFTYSANGQLLTGVNDPTYQVSYSYESPYSQTLITKASYANGPTFVFDYDANGRIQQQSLLNGDSKVTYRYSADGLSYSILDGTGAATTVTQTADGGFTQTNPLGKSISGSYDAITRTWSYTDPNGAISKETYSSDGRLIETTNALNQKVALTYEPTFGQLAGFTDAKGNGIDYAYDAKGNLNKVTYEDGSFEQYTYSQTTGLLTQSTNRRGQSINLQYNSSYQLTETKYSNNATEIYGYNAATGQLNSITDARGTTSIEFNPTMRQSKITYGNGRSLSYTFDILGRRTQLVVQDNMSSRTTSYTYDSAGRLDKLTDGLGQLIVDYDYDAVTGRLQKETNGNGTYTTYEYDAAGQITKLGNYAPNQSVTSQFEYTYDNLGQKTQVKSLDGTWTYGYDAIGQLTRGVFTSTNTNIANQDLTYEYDAAGNRVRTIVNGVTESVTTNNLNQYTQSGDTAYRYDADGNLIEKQVGSQLWKYSYDDQSRLIKVVDSTNNTTQYEYDIFGNRSATIYNGTRTEYLVDPSGLSNIVSEYDGSGGLVASYTHGLGLVSRDGNGTSAYYDFDAIGSTTSLTGGNGTVINRYGYKPFGENQYESETVDNSFEYVGQYGVSEERSGLHYMQTRFYDSKIGRFTAIDSIGLQGKDLNFYRYVQNNPTSYIDPEGKSIFTGLGSPTGTAAFMARGIGGVAGLATGFSIGFLGGKYADLLSKGTNFTMVIGAGLFVSDDPIESGIGGFTAGLGFGGAIGQFIGNLGAPPGGGRVGLPNSSPIGMLPVFPTYLPTYTNPLRNGFAGTEIYYSCPLVLDLDNDGIELTNLNTTRTYFDVDGDGFREATGWVKADDGILVRDVNNDGFINDNTELFGNNNAAQINSGFTKLKTLDSNADGWISAADTAFNSLNIWRDLDQDGISDTGELFTLNQLGIARISVNPTATSQTIEGNNIFETAKYELTDGTQRTIVDAWFALDDMDSRYDFRSTHNAPVTLTNEILGLPDLRGFGILPNLSIAMAKDPDLLNLVKTFNAKLLNDDFAGADALIESILFRWAKVDTVNPSSRTSYINAQHLGFLEAVMGRTWRNSSSSNPGLVPSNDLEKIYVQLKQSFAARLMTTYADFDVKLDAVNDRLVFNGSLLDAANRLQEVMGQIAVSPSFVLTTQKALLEAYLAESHPEGVNYRLLTFNSDNYSEPLGTSAAIYGLQGNDTINGNSGNDTIDGGMNDDVVNGGGGNDFLLGSSGNDFIEGSDGIDTINGGVGNDTLSGGWGDDIYLFERGSGQDTIREAYSGYGDVLKFGTGITKSDLTWTFNGRDLTFTVKPAAGSTTPADTITIENFNNGPAIKNFIVAGQTLTLTEVMTGAIVSRDDVGSNSLSWSYSAIKFDGADGNDSIYASNFNDEIYGGNGADIIQVYAGDDIVSGGAGNDTLYGSDGNDTLDGGADNDILQGENGNDSLIGGVGNDSLSGGVGNDSLNGGDGDDSINGENDNDFLVGGNGNDLIEGADGIDTLNGGVGNDTLSGGSGDDIYLFERGSGQDIIRESYSGSGDVLKFGTGIAKTDLTWTFNGRDLIFTVKPATGSTSPADTITIENFNNGPAIKNFTVDGQTLTLTELMTGAAVSRDDVGSNSLSWSYSAIKFDGAAGNDSIYASNFNDEIYGADGADIIQVYAGDDIASGGAGNDTIYGSDGNDTLDGGTDNDSLLGENGNDSLVGGSGNDTLSGGADNDTLDGGAENDSLKGESGNDSIFGGAGNDTLSGSDGNDTLDGGTDNDSLLGESGNDSLIGGSGSDSLNGGIGNDFINAGDGDDQVWGGEGIDILEGGIGNDLLFLNLASQTGNLLIDNLTSGINLTNIVTATNFERFSLIGGSGNDKFIQSGLVSGVAYRGSDSLDGGLGNDTLNAGLGLNDTVIGGTGDDLLILDYSAGDTGNGMVFTATGSSEASGSASRLTTLGTTLDSINFSGINRFQVTGTSQADTFTAGMGSDTIDGGAGNDTIDGGDGNDSLMGGSGNDSLHSGLGTDTLDGGDGDDVLRSLLGDDIIKNGNAWSYSGGETSANLLIGGAGNDTLLGSLGADTLRGGIGNDSLHGHVGNDSLEGGDGQDSLDGSIGDDTLDGGNDNDTLDGGWNNDSLLGGAGNDFLNGNFGADTLDGGDGDDLLRAMVGDDVIWGASGVISSSGKNDANLLIGGLGNDTLIGSYGNDTLLGGAGNDRLDGNFGSDTLDGGDGDDILLSFISPIENSGENASHLLIGGAGNDILLGSVGNDTLEGGAGNDTLLGNWGDDTYHFRRGDGNDVIDHFYPSIGEVYDGGNDTLVFDSSITLSDITASTNGSDLLLTISGGTDSVTIRDFYVSSNFENFSIGGQLFTIDQIPSAVNGTVGNDTLIGTSAHNTINGFAGNDSLSGNDGNDTLNGGDGNDTLDGGTGNDVLVGGTGNDSYFVDSTSDVVNETSAIATEIDSVTTTVTYTLGANLENLTLSGNLAINGTGNTLNNRITGNSVNNVLDGGAGNDILMGDAGNDTLTGGDGTDTLDGGTGSDSLVGGTGNDSYVVDSTGDVVIETSTIATEIDSVTATVSYTLSANLENLTLGGSSIINGTGNSLNNLIIGNSGVNNLIGASGNDTLDGAAGNDTLSGDDGNDSLIGGSGNDSLSGGAGNDTIDGGLGSDTLIGGAGNDSYVVDSTGDIVTETSTTTAEIDSVASTITYTLGANLENLTLSGSSVINGTGNTLNNQLTGNGTNNRLSGLAGDDVITGAAGDDTLDGGDGNDSLTGDDGNDSLTGGLGIDTLLGGLGNDSLMGGAGNDLLTGNGGSDRFLFDTNAAFSASALGIDRISDFLIGTDKIVLDKTTFTALSSIAGNGFSITSDFASVADSAAAAVSSARIVYGRATGSLYYNQNGAASGLGTGGEFAVLSGLPTLTAADFVIQT